MSQRRQYLVDTHVLLWAAASVHKLSPPVRAILSDPEAEILTSPASAYEICWKHRRGKLENAGRLVRGYANFVHSLGMSCLDATLGDSILAASFDAAHPDPWDRLLAAQAHARDIPLLSIDSGLDHFPIKRIW